MELGLVFFKPLRIVMLYIVPTPIGNLEDITFRAITVLKAVDTILAEDTRTSKKLLNHYEIETPLRSYHSFNEHASVNGIIERLQNGETMALISDAGTPGISDPGFLLTRACMQNDIKMECLPGPTAFVPALVVSGLPCDRFHFEGFLPHKKGRKTRLEFLAQLPNTFVLYESPFRLLKCLNQLSEHCGSERLACVCRELTKLHEEIVTDTLENLIKHFSEKKIKGEIVIVVEGK